MITKSFGKILISLKPNSMIWTKKMKLFRVKLWLQKKLRRTFPSVIKIKRQSHWNGKEHAQTRAILTSRMHQNCRSPNSITNDHLEEHVILFFEKLGVIMEPMNVVACHRLKQTGRGIVKLLNRKDGQNVWKEKHKLRSINLYDDNTDTNNKRKIFINQSLCPYYRKLYGMVKDLNNEGLIDSFWITNGTTKIRESSQ